MGKNGLAGHPGVVAGKVTWRHVGVVASFMVQISDNLTAWPDIVPPDPSIDTSITGQVSYTLPTGAAKKILSLGGHAISHGSADAIWKSRYAPQFSNIFHAVRDTGTGR
jgi:hypothetical protein